MLYLLIELSTTNRGKSLGSLALILGLTASVFSVEHEKRENMKKYLYFHVYIDKRVKIIYNYNIGI